MGVPLALVLVKSQIRAPDGAATDKALPSMQRVLSRRERVRVFASCGRRYGGSSRAKAGVSPFKIVDVNSFVTSNVTATPIIISSKTKSADTTEERGLPNIPPMNIAEIAVSIPNLPLQGINVLVIMAAIRSAGEEIIRQPVTPTALHPSPIHMKKAI